MTMSQKGRALPVSDDECLIMLDATPGDVGHGHGQRLPVRMGRQAPYGERIWDKSAGPVVLSRYQGSCVATTSATTQQIRLDPMSWPSCMHAPRGDLVQPRCDFVRRGQ
jgi:hypothetical protein